MKKKIGFIGGGQMAEAIIKGLLQSDLFSQTAVCVCEPLESRKQHLKAHYGLELIDTPEELCAAIDVLVLAVKPQVMPVVLQRIRTSIRNHLVITIAAGLPISSYEEQFDTLRPAIVRVMPNMGALVQQCATALCRNDTVTDSDFSYTLTLFETIGSVVVVDESQMDAVTGLSGSGPAYVFSFIEALIDAGVKIGLSREISRNLTLQTISAAVELARTSEKHPAVLRDQVTSPGGTTASGLHVLEENGFSGTIISAVEASRNRSIVLGQRP
jgi:pyrroline-5-carboxylate reductase